MEPQSFETYAKVKLELFPQVGVETKSVKPPPIFMYLAILIFIFNVTAVAFQTATSCQVFQKASHKIKIWPYFPLYELVQRDPYTGL